MKKITLIASLSLLLSSATAFAAETNFEWDFSKGFEGFTLYDQDGRKPQSSAQQYGFEATGATWIQLYYYKDPVAASNSTHSPIGRAEDWLITPAITVGENNIFSFDAATAAYSGADKVGEFAVKISTAGTAVEDFTDLKANATATSEWSALAFDLSEYAGKTVYLAIVNTARSKDILIVDNLFVGIPAMAKIEAVYTRIQEKTTAGQRIQVNLSAGLKETITSIDATLTCGDFTTTRTVSELEIAPGSNYSFQFNDALPAPTPGEAQHFEIEVVVNNIETVSTEGEIITQAYQPAKRVVFETLTYTTCPWCPRSHVVMDELDKTYPDSYIGLAGHVGDVMQNYDYAVYLSGYLSGAPSGRSMRQTGMIDPLEYQTYYNKFIKTPALADITLYAAWTDESETAIKLTSTTTFALNAANFETRLEYYVAEDNINVPGDSRYNQYNNYAGGSYGEMGGYENLPSTVPAKDMFYNDVVRHVVSDEVGEGIRGSVPTQITMDEAYTHTTQFEIPKSVLKIENCEFVVFLIDYATGNILNAARTKVINPSAVNKVNGDNATRAYATDDAVRVDVNTNALVEVNIYATDGRLVYTAAPRKVSGQATIDCPISGHGVYLVNVVCDGVAKTHKVIL